MCLALTAAARRRWQRIITCFSTGDKVALRDQQFGERWVKGGQGSGLEVEVIEASGAAPLI